MGKWKIYIRRIKRKKLLPYAIGKKKTIEDTEDSEPINILININGQEI